VDDTDIAVKVKDGVVTLSGYARNLFHTYGAEDAVKRVAGVTAVANDIDLQRGVRPNLSDPEIAHNAVTALRRALPLCGGRVRPLVRGGIVTLEGTVNDPFQREVAEDAVRGIKQIMGVVNAIALEHSVDVVHPEDIRCRIQQSFQRSEHLDASSIDVAVRGSVVTLRGHVCTWSERREAAECAWLVSGVRHVCNELLVSAPT
jgi:osmotically-inducible protein OsmY